MRGPHPAMFRNATKAPAQVLTVPRGRRPVPTRTRLRTRQVPVVMYVAALLLLPGLMVVGSMSAGWWATTGTSTTAKAVTPSAEGGTGAAAPADPADLKGSMTVQQVVDAFPPITAAQITAAFGAPLDTPTSTRLSAMVEGGNGMDIPGMRIWLAGRVAG